MRDHSLPPAAVLWQNGRLRLLDQRRLPEKVAYLDIGTVEAAHEAIRTLAVRGAPAIGIAAAYALVVAMTAEPEPDAARFRSVLTEHARHLESARPTAVNLAWACARLLAAAERSADLSTIWAEAEAIHAEDRRICRAIGNHGQALIPENAGVLTHCNAGSLAVSELGTATAPLYLGHAAGKRLRVFVDETRPLLQGARLTAWELGAAGIDVTLICDSAAATFMAAGEIDLAIVGTDRVTANGDVVNKIGTLGVAVLCRHFDIPFYVALPSSTFDPDTATGAQVPIEERDPAEVLGDRAADVPTRNPAFDVTPAHLVTAFITDRGIVRPPFPETLVSLSG
ncbi:MAG: S-methyl-5-thioribose-1-phosphate isomerase [Pseudomonadales bacterium]|nr:S-methyl-5-thioribose-1-phosphate isomerase [Pseudomonadales bacterium]NIX09664.1 S-methyl-5-thioribose-1-phosphate isomerase [Pseudomonadales bacterium]